MTRIVCSMLLASIVTMHAVVLTATTAQDQAATWRLELLEWIVILLIAVSILLPFVVNLPGH
jgi:hypothetical protein